MEEMGQGAEKESKPVLYFEKAKKGMILNATAARTIAALYGDESDDWIGQRIMIYPTTVNAFGKLNHVIRVKPQRPPNAATASQTESVPTSTTQTQPVAPGDTTAASDDSDEVSAIEDEADYIDDHDEPEDYHDEPDFGAPGAPGEPPHDNPWDDAPAPTGPRSKPITCSQAQLTRITLLAADFYGGKFDPTKLALDTSFGVVNQLAKLLPSEADVLIKRLETEIAQADNDAEAKAIAKREKGKVTIA